MSAEHTPGPWKIEDGEVGYALVSPDGTWLADIPSWTGSVETASEASANARLIAAAPLLLEALENIVAMAEAETWDKATTGRQILFKDAHLAIAAARGE